MRGDDKLLQCCWNIQNGHAQARKKGNDDGEGDGIVMNFALSRLAKGEILVPKASDEPVNGSDY